MVSKKIRHYDNFSKQSWIPVESSIADIGPYIIRNIESNLKDGKGVQIWPDGSLYEGYWKFGQPNGYGRMFHADGDVYIGYFLDGKAEGKGKYIHADQSTYDGNWHNDKYDG